MSDVSLRLRLLVAQRRVVMGRESEGKVAVVDGVEVSRKEAYWVRYWLATQH